jgi:REP element-mobilizing transposase RayT
VLNRANARLPLFQKDGDYAAFEQVLTEARQLYDVPVLAYCLMPNHWHLVLWPRADRDLSRFVGWLTLTHTQRWHAHYHTVGCGHAYQGRFKSFPVQEDDYFLTVCRYVERNALRAGLVPRAEAWRWGSLWRWRHGARRRGPCWGTGRCRAQRDGRRGWTGCRARRSWRRCGGVSGAAARSGTRRGWRRRSRSWGWRRQSGRAAGPGRELRNRPKKVPDTFSSRPPVPVMP